MARVVIVEPERGMRITLRRLLEGDGHNVVATANGEFALDLLGTAPFAVVALVDIRLAGEPQTGRDGRNRKDGGNLDAARLLDTLGSLADDDLIPHHAIALLAPTARARLPAALGFIAAARRYPLVRLPPDITRLLALVLSLSAGLDTPPHTPQSPDAARGALRGESV